MRAAAWRKRACCCMAEAEPACVEIYCCALQHDRLLAGTGSKDSEDTKDAIEGFNQVVEMEGEKGEW
eukprot:364902-Chlamydomonas_euryale.AAC.3